MILRRHFTMPDGLQLRRQQQRVSSGGGVHKRPRIESDDIVVEILSRLPVKCLIRFRCVCKSWRDLISGSHLVRKHLSHAVTGINPDSLRLLVSTNPLEIVNYGALKDVNGHFASQRLYLPEMLFIWLKPVILSKIVGSCNGLMCLEVNKRIVLLWNPCTRDFKLLPVLNLYAKGLLFYGFGYDSVTQDYKVMLGTESIATGSLKIVVAVFTLKKSYWRIVEDLSYVKLNGQGCLLNGFLHWIEHKWTEEEALSPILSSRIISFDLAGEKFQEMLPLSYLSDQNFISARIGTIGNRLFVYFFNHNDISVTIWVMNEYGVKESWSKLVQIPRFVLRQLEGKKFLNPICIFENGEVLMSCNRSVLVLYNPKEQTFRNVLQSPFPLPPEAAMHVETLVSPVTGNGEDI